MEFYTVALQKHWNYLNKLKDKSLIDIRISNRNTVSKRALFYGCPFCFSHLSCPSGDKRYGIHCLSISAILLIFFLYHTGYSLVHLIITYFANFREGFQSKYKDNIKTYSEDALGVNHTKSEDEQ